MFRKKGLKIILALLAVVVILVGSFALGVMYLLPTVTGRQTVGEIHAEEAAISMPDNAPMPAPMPTSSPGGAMDKAQAEEGFAVGTRDMASRNVAISPQAPTVSERKIVKSSYLALETIEFDRTIDSIVGKATAMGGYVESSSLQGTSLRSRGIPQQRTANYQIRIPQEHFEGFMSAVGELGAVVSKQLFGEDITGQFIDTEARLRTLRVQEDRLLTILARAEELADIIEVERELSRIRFEIESHTGTLKAWDHMVQYARVGIDVYEVEELEQIEEQPENWFDRIVKAFANSITNLVDLVADAVVFMVAAIPYLAVLTIFAWIGWKLLRKKMKSTEIKGGNENEK